MKRIKGEIFNSRKSKQKKQEILNCEKNYRKKNYRKKNGQENLQKATSGKKSLENQQISTRRNGQ